MSTASTREALLQLFRPVVESDGLDLEDVEVVAAGKRRLVRVFVDRDGGLDLDTVAHVSHAASAALDAVEGPAGTGGPLGRAPYVLEVSSPGVDRPLTAPRHWRRACTRLVLVELADGASVTGRVVRAGDDGVTLDLEGTERHVPWESVRRGRVQVEFTHPAGLRDDNDDDDGGGDHSGGDDDFDRAEG